MKRRKRKGHHRLAGRGKALGLFAGRGERKRKSWTFERLEDRLVFSANPVAAVTVNLNQDGTPSPATIELLNELNWAAMQASYETNTTAPQFTLMSLPSDPMFPNQWHLLNTGQEVGNPDLQHLFGVAGEDLNVVPAWNMTDANGDPVTGKGVLVAVNDSGVQLVHPDLAANISPTLRFNANLGTSNVSPDLFDPESYHGTAVSGIIAAVENNGVGGTGIAPGATIVPVKLDFGPGATLDQFSNAFNYSLQHGIDITNNSWGPVHEFTRTIYPVDPFTAFGSANLQLLQDLRDSAVFGRDGLGMINVFSSGNNGGPFYNQAFTDIGNYSSSSYNLYANSRYVITVTGVDHDGQYINPDDGTFTDYPEIGPNVLVAAPTGSAGRLSVGNDDGYGSGIWTTDLVGDFGFNAAPLPNGTDLDSDPWPDPNYTSRFNGTSASAPMVSGVIALMLQANPNLTYRDVQEILVRSARQNAQFETPSSGALLGPRTTWQVNQIQPFRDPDPWDNHFLYPLPVGPITGSNPIDAIHNPIADPSVDTFFFGGTEFAPDAGDGERQFLSHYEPQVPVYTTGSGYTVSQGYGIYSEQTGYGHGVIDAGAAVSMAKQWHALDQNIDPGTEKTYSTSVISLGGGFNLPAAEKMANNHTAMVVPGGIGGRAGFIAFWDEFFQPITINNGVPDPASGPFSEAQPPVNTRGSSYIDFNVPPPQEINVEWVEVKLDISGPTDALDNLRIMLESPEGTMSEFNEYWVSLGIASPLSLQEESEPGNAGSFLWRIDPRGSLNDFGGDFVWTFATNRSWGESTNAAVIIDPVTGEPAMLKDPLFGPISPIFRNWELHLENWATEALSLRGVEVVWHGKPIGGGKLDPNYGSSGVASAQRIQGFVGIDTNGDNTFNYSRELQSVFDFDGDPNVIRLGEVQRTQDFEDNNFNGVYDTGDVINQEPFAENVIVDAYRVWNGVAETTPIARFLTGADGNYYFDVDVQGDLAQTLNPASAHFGQTIEYEIRATDPLGRLKLNDVDTPAMITSNPLLTYLPHYKQVWRINPDWFYAPDRDNPLTPGNNPGEIFFDPSTNAPVPFDGGGAFPLPRIPMAVKNINFLLKDTAPTPAFDVTGTVYSDVNANGKFDAPDSLLPGAFVYWDQNRNGIQDAGETTVVTNASGQYTLHIDLSTLTPVPTGNATYQIGVVKPTSTWNFTDPNQDGVETVFAGPGSPVQTVNFYLQPPNANPPGGNGPGTIQGVVFVDLNANGTQDIGETGVTNFQVFIDTNQNGALDAGETSTTTAANGSYFFSNVSPGVYRIDIVIANEGLPSAAWQILNPTLGYRDVQVFPGGSVTGANFGLKNLADSDWGDLPDSYNTLSTNNGPSHKVAPGFQLGPTVTGEINGQPSPGANTDNDDGVQVISNGGTLFEGVNTLRVTVFGVGGLLTGWMDFNNDGHFDESERLNWTLAGTPLGGEADLNPGTYDLQITIPAGAAKGPIASRFRWGEQGLTFTGPAQIGEVEDYRFNLAFVSGDYNRDGTVDQADFIFFRMTFGQAVGTPFSGADGNGNGVIDQGDYDVWRAHLGETVPVPAPGAFLVSAGSSASTNAASGSSTTEDDFWTTFGGSAGGASGGQSYNTLSPSQPTPPSTDASVSTGTSTPVSATPSFGIFEMDAARSSLGAFTTSSVVQPSGVNTARSNMDLFLLDSAWANLNHNSYDHADESLYADQSHDTESSSDLALAAVLKEDDDWWKSI